MTDQLTQQQTLEALFKDFDDAMVWTGEWRGWKLVADNCTQLSAAHPQFGKLQSFQFTNSRWCADVELFCELMLREGHDARTLRQFTTAKLKTYPTGHEPAYKSQLERRLRELWYGRMKGTYVSRYTNGEWAGPNPEPMSGREFMTANSVMDVGCVIGPFEGKLLNDGYIIEDAIDKRRLHEEARTLAQAYIVKHSK